MTTKKSIPLRLPIDLAAAVEAAAKGQGVSLNQYVVNALLTSIGGAVEAPAIKTWIAVEHTDHIYCINCGDPLLGRAYMGVTPAGALVGPYCKICELQGDSI